MRVIDLFREWDDDESGYVDKKEFVRAMRQLGVSKEEVARLPSLASPPLPRARAAGRP